MRFMVLVKASKDSEAGVLPDETLLTEMTRYNEELVKAGVLLAGEGLQPSAKGARVRFSGGNRTVVDGPFAETKELIAGFWMIQVKSKDEAIAWVKRCPNPHAGEAEALLDPLLELGERLLRVRVRRRLLAAEVGGRVLRLVARGLDLANERVLVRRQAGLGEDVGLEGLGLRVSGGLVHPALEVLQ